MTNKILPVSKYNKATGKELALLGAMYQFFGSNIDELENMLSIHKFTSATKRLTEDTITRNAET
jgi:hypothetical protein